MTGLRDLSLPTILLIDTETSGLYRDDLAMDDPGQPWAVEISALLCNTAGVVTNSFTHIVKADGRKIKEGALQVHGITDRAASQIGIPEGRVLGILRDMLQTAPLREMKVVSYSDLDKRVIASLFARFALSLNKKSNSYDGVWLSRTGVQFVDLQKPYCQQLCKIPTDRDDGSFKWPSLEEAAEIILGRRPRTGVHHAFEDMLILKDLYFECQRRDLFQEAPPP